MKHLPKINPFYWALVISANTMGETAGDLISQTFNLGYGGGTIALLFLLVVIFPTSYSKVVTRVNLNLLDKASYISSKLHINIRAIQLALVGFEKLKASGQIENTNYLTIADFSKASSEERFYVIDMNTIDTHRTMST